MTEKLTCILHDWQGHRGLPCPWCELNRLRKLCDRLTGMKFSDRMHDALVSRAETAEAERDAMIVNNQALIKHGDTLRTQLTQAQNESQALIDSVAKTVRNGEFICSKCGLRHTLGEPPKGDF